MLFVDLNESYVDKISVTVRPSQLQLSPRSIRRAIRSRFGKRIRFVLDDEQVVDIEFIRASGYSDLRGQLQQLGDITVKTVEK